MGLTKPFFSCRPDLTILCLIRRVRAYHVFLPNSAAFVLMYKKHVIINRVFLYLFCIVMQVVFFAPVTLFAQKTAEIKSPDRKEPGLNQGPNKKPKDENISDEKQEAEKKTSIDKNISETKSEAKKESKPDPISEFEKQLQRELEGGGAPGERKDAERPSWLWQFTKTTFALLVMLGFFFLVYRVWLFKKNLPKVNKSALKVLYEYPLMPGKFLQIVDLSDRLLVLGISDSAVNLVTEITDRVSVDRIRLECERDNTLPGADFLTELTKVIKTRITTGKPGIKNFQEQLDTNENNWAGSRESSLNRLKQIREQKNRLRDDQL